MPFLLPIIGTALVAVTGAVSASVAGAAVAIGFGDIAAGAIGSIVAGALVTTAEYGALAGASALLTPKPKINTPGSPQAFKADPQAPIVAVMGRYGVGGYLAYETTSGGSNKAEHGAQGNEYLTHFTILSGLGPIEGVESLRFNDTILTFNGEQCSGGYVPQQEVQSYNPGYKQYGSGALAGNYQNDVFAGHAWQTLTNGGVPNPTFAYPAKLNADSGALPEWAGKGFSGFAASALTIVYDQTVYTGGVPQRQWVLKGVHRYDPRHDSGYPGGAGTQAWPGPGSARDFLVAARNTWTWSENPAIHALNYALGDFLPDGVTGLGRRYLGIGAGGTQSAGLGGGVDVAAFVHAANVADANGWRICGQWTSADGKWSVLTAMLQACGAIPLYDRGRISCMVAEPRVSLGTVAAADLAGDVTLDTSVSMRERANTVFYSYSSEAHRWQVVQADTPISPATYVAEDGAVRVGPPLSFEYVPSVDQAAQLTAYAIADGRETPNIVVVGKPHLRGYAVGDCLTLDLPEAGLAATKVVVTKRSTSLATGQVTLTCRSETDAKHDYCLGRTGVAPPTPGISGVDPSIVPAPIPAAWTAAPATATDAASGEVTHVIRINGSTIDNVFAADVIVDYATVTTVGGVDVLGPLQHASYAASVAQIDLDLPAGRYHVWLRYRSVTGAENVQNSLDLGVITVGADTAGAAAALIGSDGVSKTADDVLADVTTALDHAANALAGANTAQSTSLVAVTYNPSIINPNPDFFAYADAAAAPDTYTTTGTGAVFSRAVGVNGKPYAASITSPAAPADPVSLLQSGLRMVRGWVVVECEIRPQTTVSWLGMGARWRNSDGNFAYDINFSADPDTNGVVRTAPEFANFTYRFSKIFQCEDENYTAALVFFAATDGFGTALSGQPARSVDVDHFAVRPASQAEIDGHAALPIAMGAAASVTTEATTRANADAALSTYVTRVAASFAGGGRNLVRNPSFALGVAGWSFGASVVAGLSDSNGPYVITYPVIADNTVNYVGLATQNVPVDPGKIYSAQASIYAGVIAAPTTFVRVVFTWTQSDGVTEVAGSTPIVVQTNVDAGWTRFFLDGISNPTACTAPAGAAFARISVDVASYTGNIRSTGDNAAVTRIKLERADYASPYSDEGLSSSVVDYAAAADTATKAVADRALTLESKVDGTPASPGVPASPGLLARVTNAEGTLADVNGRTEAYLKSTVEADGSRANFELVAVGHEGSQARLTADRIALGNMGDVLVIVDGVVYIKQAVVDDLSIGTTKMKAGSISATSSVTIPGVLNLSDYATSSGRTEIASLTVTTNGGTILILATSDADHDTTNRLSALTFTLFCDGVATSATSQVAAAITSFDPGYYYGGGNFFVQFKDTPSAGTHTYSIQVDVSYGTTNSSTVANRAITVFSLKVPE